MQSFTRLGQYSSQYCPVSHTSSYALALATMATVEPSLSSCVALNSEKQSGVQLTAVVIITHLTLEIGLLSATKRMDLTLTLV